MAGEETDAGGEIESGDEESPLEELVSGAVIALTLLVAFGLMAVGYPYFWVAFIVGFAGVLPLSHGLVQYYQYRSGGSDADDARIETEDALAELRERYARGELSDAEFERRVERLVGTESVADAREYVERARDEQVSRRGVSSERPADAEGERALESGTDLERETE